MYTHEFSRRDCRVKRTLSCVHGFTCPGPDLHEPFGLIPNNDASLNNSRANNSQRARRADPVFRPVPIWLPTALVRVPLRFWRWKCLRLGSRRRSDGATAHPSLRRRESSPASSYRPINWYRHWIPRKTPKETLSSETAFQVGCSSDYWLGN